MMRIARNERSYLSRIRMAYRCRFAAFSWCTCLLPSVFVSTNLLHVPLLVLPVLLLKNRDSPLTIHPHGGGW